MKKFKNIAKDKWVDLNNFIQALQYPVSKEDVLTCAEAKGLDEYLIETLEQLEDGMHDSADELSDALADIEIL